MGAAAKQVPRVFARAFSPRGSNKIIYDSTIRDILSATRSSLLEKVLLRARVIANPHFLQLPNVGNPHLSSPPFQRIRFSRERDAAQAFKNYL